MASRELLGSREREEVVRRTAQVLDDAVGDAMAGDDEEAKRNHLCYAHLYLGLYHEALGHEEKAKAHMLKAAVDYKMDHYMGKCAQVHVKLRGWESK